MDTNVNNTINSQAISLRVSQLFASKTFSLSPVTLLSIHKYLFNGTIEGAGTLRKNNLMQNDYIFSDGKMIFSDYTIISELLYYEISEEKNFEYDNISRDAKISHISTFISSLWQIHPFTYGNTITISIFSIKYLQFLGYDISPNVFFKNLSTFRQALISANYSNESKGITKTSKPLVAFFKDIILKDYSNTDNSILHSLNEKEAMVYELLKKDPTSTIDDMAYLLEYSNRSIAYAVKGLIDKGLLERIGSKKKGTWRIKDE